MFLALRRAALTGVLAVLFLAGAARAANAGPSVGLLVDGPGAKSVRAEIVAALPGGTSLADEGAVAKALAAHHVTLKTMRAGAQSPGFVTAVHQAAVELGADAVIVAKVRAHKGKGGSELTLLAVAASQDAAVIDGPLSIAADADRPSEWKMTLGPVIDLLQGGSKSGEAKPAPATPEKKGPDEAAASKDQDEGGAAEAPAAATESPADTKSNPRSFTDAMFVGYLGLDLLGRQFHYNQRLNSGLSTTLRPYDLPSGVLLPETPGFSASVELFPLAKADGFIRDIGVNGHFGMNWAKASLGSTVVDAQAVDWGANLRARFFLGPRATAPVIGVEAGGGELSFAFNDAHTPVSGFLPTVDYGYLRFGADSRIPLGPAALLLGAGYRVILGAGELAVHFPREEVWSVDARVGAALRIAPGLEARLVVKYTRVWTSFNPDPGDAYVAGGGLDQFLNADLGVAGSF